MKNSIVGLSIAVTLLCAFLLFEKNREVAAAREKIAAGQREQERMAAEASQQEKQNRKLQSRLQDSREQALENSVAAQDLQRKLARAEQDRPAKPRTVSELFKNQMMVEALKAEAKEGTAKNVEALFDDGLAEQLHLNADQSTALKQLLTQKSSLLWEKMFLPMVTGELDEAGMAQAGPQIKQALEDNAAQIKALLGDDGYQAYQQFDQSQAEREQVRKFAKQEAKAGMALSADQQSQLLALMTEERSVVRAQSDFGDPEKMDFEHWYDNFSDDKIAAYGKGLGEANDRILQRAQTMLTPDQLDQFRQALVKQALDGMMVVQSTKAMMPQPAGSH